MNVVCIVTRGGALFFQKKFPPLLVVAPGVLVLSRKKKQSGRATQTLDGFLSPSSSVHLDGLHQLLSAGRVRHSAMSTITTQLYLDKFVRDQSPQQSTTTPKESTKDTIGLRRHTTNK